MRPLTVLAVMAAAGALALAIYVASGGRFVFLVLPLIFGLPFLGRRR